MKIGRYKREVSAAAAYAALLLAVGVASPAFFSAGNLRDMALNNAPVLLVAVGMTLVILVGEIDISVGSQFAVCSVAAGWLAKEGVPVALLLPSVLALGALMGAVNGLLVGYLRLPSIIVTLAMLVAWRDALRWVTQGEWVQDLPDELPVVRARADGRRSGSSSWARWACSRPSAGRCGISARGGRSTRSAPTRRPRASRGSNRGGSSSACSF